MSESNITEALAQYQPTDAAISELAAEFMDLKIEDLDDRDGYKRVHEARMVVKSKRVLVEKTRKALKADALEYGRRVDSEAKRLTALLTPIESHLQSEESRIDDEKERVKREAEQKRQTLMRARVEKLSTLGTRLMPFEIEALSDDEFRSEMRRAASEKAERDRAEADAKTKAAAEEAERRAEADRMEVERKALEEAQAKLEAERAELAAAKAEAARVAELELAKREAAEKAVHDERETYERLRCEEQAATRKAELEAEKAEKARRRAEEVRPDQEKILALADYFEDGLELPPLSNRSDGPVRRVVLDAAKKLRSIAADLVGGEVAS